MWGALLLTKISSKPQAFANTNTFTSSMSTYVIAGQRGSGVICLNGAAARAGQKGDHVIIMAYASMTPDEAKTHRPKVVFVGDNNEMIRVADYEKHGKLM